MTQFVKFSQFAAANLASSANMAVGYNGATNYQTPITNSWTTATRPSPAYNGLSGFNSDLGLYEYFTTTGNVWLQFGTNNFIQGLWTPVDASGAGLTFIAAGSYTQIANVVNAWCNITYPLTADTSNAIIGGLPIIGGNNIKNGGNIVYTNVSTLRYVFMNAGGAAGTTADLYDSSGSHITNATMTGATLYLQFTYGT